MARELKIDVIVDDHGAVQTLQNVAKAEDQVTAAATPMARGLDTVFVSTTEADRVLSDLHVSASRLPSTLSEVRGSVNDLADGFGLTIDKMGAFPAAGLAVGTAMAAWNIGRHIAEWGGLDDKIAKATSTLLGWGDAAGEAGAAKMDTLATATAFAHTNIVDLNFAMELNAIRAQENADHLERLAAGAKKGAEMIAEMREVTAQSIREGSKNFQTFLDQLNAQEKRNEEETARWTEKVHELENGGLHAFGTLHQWYGELQRDQKYVNDLSDQNIQKFIAAQQAADQFLAKALADAQALDAEIAAHPIGQGPPHLDANGRWVDGNGNPMSSGARATGGSLVPGPSNSDLVSILNHSVDLGGQNTNATVGSGGLVLNVDAKGAFFQNETALQSLADRIAGAIGVRAVQTGAVR